MPARLRLALTLFAVLCVPAGSACAASATPAVTLPDTGLFAPERPGHFFAGSAFGFAAGLADFQKPGSASIQACGG